MQQALNPTNDHCVGLPRALCAPQVPTYLSARMKHFEPRRSVRIAGGPVPDYAEMDGEDENGNRVTRATYEDAGGLVDLMGKWGYKMLIKL